jgi:hypothetical protein
MSVLSLSWQMIGGFKSKTVAETAETAETAGLNRKLSQKRQKRRCS